MTTRRDSVVNVPLTTKKEIAEAWLFLVTSGLDFEIKSTFGVVDIGTLFYPDQMVAQHEFFESGDSLQQAVKKIAPKIAAKLGENYRRDWLGERKAVAESPQATNSIDLSNLSEATQLKIIELMRNDQRRPATAPETQLDGDS